MSNNLLAFLQVLGSDDKWMYAPIAYNGMDMVSTRIFHKTYKYLRSLLIITQSAINKNDCCVCSVTQGDPISNFLEHLLTTILLIQLFPYLDIFTYILQFITHIIHIMSMVFLGLTTY